MLITKQNNLGKGDQRGQNLWRLQRIKNNLENTEVTLYTIV